MGIGRRRVQQGSRGNGRETPKYGDGGPERSG